ncbi:hypothetical protein AB4072_12960 [Microvirga sp. 2MCAF38]|uniref:hypothetical protein n=1 Tax=Microvirga sp. 2MCAF38 TaxID=3232989 RepID=UPI003F96DCF1
MATIPADPKTLLLTGTAENDLLEAAWGDYTVFGDAGNDTLVFSGTQNVSVDLNKTGPQFTGFGTYQISSVEGVLADQGNDRLKGNSGSNLFYGGGGKDTIYGGGGHDLILGEAGNDRIYGDGGNDILQGGAGNDTLTGGKGKDYFSFSEAKPGRKNVDTITDFSVRDDSMLLDKTYFTKLGKKGVLKPDAFHIGPAAHDASDRVIYNSDTGALYYDPDGTGQAAAVLFAKLKPGLLLTNKDLFVV